MQASKILPKAIYAIKRGDGYVRFNVTAVVTRRTRATGGPHDYDSVVEGWITEDAQDGKAPTITIKPDAVLGPFEEYAELAARKRAEDEASEREGRSRMEARQRLWTLLYDKCGLERPNEPRDYRQAFRIGSAGEIEVRTDVAVAALTALLEGRT
jgi:hypothetical protein